MASSTEVCPHCDHPLRDHRIQRPVYDNRAAFRCRFCGCAVNGSAEAVLTAGADTNEGETDG